MNKSKAISLIYRFALNQSKITKEANSKRGYTKKSVVEERMLAKLLLRSLCPDHTDNDFNELINLLNS